MSIEIFRFYMFQGSKKDLDLNSSSLPMQTRNVRLLCLSRIPVVALTKLNKQIL